MSAVAEVQNQNGAGGVITVSERAPQRLVAHDHGQFANLLDTAKFEHLWRISVAFSKSDLVPDQFRGKPENCFIGVQMAIRLGVDPFMFLQSCYVVHGRPGIEAKLAIALANSSGVFVGPIRYDLEGEGKQRRCTAKAVVRETGEEIRMTVDWAMVQAEGWADKKGSKWLTIPEVMFRYRSAMLLIRTHCPEVIMGMQSKEELEDLNPPPLARVATQQVSSLDALADRMTGIAQEIREQTEAEQRAAADASKANLPGGEIAADLSAFHDALLAATKTGDITVADSKLRGPSGRELSEGETVLADAWIVEAKERIEKERKGASTQKELA